MAQGSRAAAGGDPVPGGGAPRGTQGGSGATHDPGDGQGPVRGPGRRAGSDRHVVLHRRRRPPPPRLHHAERDAEQGRVLCAGAARSRRHYHPVELPGGNPVLEDRAGARVREHGRLQARVLHPARRPPVRRDLRGSRASPRRAQYRNRAGIARRRCPGRASPGPRRLLYGIDRDRVASRRAGGPPGQARVPRDGRQERRDRDAGRGSRARHGRPGVERVRDDGGSDARRAAGSSSTGRRSRTSPSGSSSGRAGCGWGTACAPKPRSGPW